MNWLAIIGWDVSEDDIYYINFKHLVIYILTLNLASKKIHY